MINMSIRTDLGRVRGDKGVAFQPIILEDNIDNMIIGWNATEEGYEGEYPDQIIIQKSIILPVLENNVLSWYQHNNQLSDLYNDLLPEPINVKGDKGDTGDTKINILIYDSLEDIDIDDTSTLYYIGNNTEDYAVYVYDPSYERKYRQVGLSSLNLENYYNKTESDDRYATKQYVDTEISTNIARAIDIIDSNIIPKLG